MLLSRKTLYTILFNLVSTIGVWGQSPYKVLIIDGQNDHKVWQQTTQMMREYLEETGLFSVEVATNPPSEGGALDSFIPDFSEYEVVLSNYNGYSWPENVKTAFENFVNGGGGLVVVHSANNSFPEWQAYNRMIGVGGGGGRDEKAGPFVYYDEGKKELVYDTSPALAGAHGPEHQFRIIIRSRNHPITKGMPPTWLHENDALYNQLRGPAENMEVLATAFSPLNLKGTGRHEPVMMVINYGKGRVFHTTLGHNSDSQKGIGFITTLQRGTEWAARGAVTQKIPEDFPGVNSGSRRP
ncbi:ThuA domain-containing protein [Cyclobacterium jeungdonense]|uniref:ThuA domain-containing protein n=1 Tax=Cyclobacterium jeungdonense TaxID=708087 RepID=A0ABT8C933_9BACT|nr:ThuA domain-containing protein [Cyclobacterium jeungdonense]MDN3688877.1 ThuA domain-containing protein [Cyclobacterium jeungdonense]